MLNADLEHVRSLALINYRNMIIKSWPKPSQNPSPYSTLFIGK